MRLVILSTLLMLTACDSSIIVEDRQSSPGGQWTAEVNSYTGSDAKVVTLTRNTIFGKIGLGSLTNGRTAEPALLKWLSNSHLVIAALDEEAFPEDPVNIWGAQITYLVYSANPGSFQDESLKQIALHRLSFSHSFEELNIVTPARLGCSLTVASSGEPPERQVRLQLEVYKDLHFDARQPELYGRSYSSMTIAAPQYILEPLRYVTGAAFDSIIMGTRAQVNRNFTSVRRPPRRGSGWLAWQRISRENLFLILDKMKSGLVEFDFGFWLDNTEEIYTSAEAADLHTIEAFEQCIAQNSIFQ